MSHKGKYYEQKIIYYFKIFLNTETVVVFPCWTYAENKTILIKILKTGIKIIFNNSFFKIYIYRIIIQN